VGMPQGSVIRERHELSLEGRIAHKKIKHWSTDKQKDLEN